MKMLIKPSAEPAAMWAAEFAKLMPELELVVWPDVPDPAAIEFALVGYLPGADLARLPNLKLIMTIPAGVNHLVNDPEFPRHIPMARSLPPGGDALMTEFALLHVLRHHRHARAYAAQQRERKWAKLPLTEPGDCRVGVMGVGAIGAAAAQAIQRLGFDVAGWSRSPKHLDGITSFAGDAQLEAFLSRTDILVCLLPVTAETNALINKRTLSLLPPGASVINMARGSLLVEADLLEALDSGHLSEATLDVTQVEPLPDDSPLWTHPLITITPHAGSRTSAAVAAPVVIENIRRRLANEPLLNPVDLAAGY